MFRAAFALATLLYAAPAAAQPWPAIDRLLANQDRPGMPGCAIGIFRNGRVEQSRTFGLAALDTGRAITPDTVFEIGSLSKQFTGFALLLLEADGRISLSDPIGRYLPELPAFLHVITIEQALRHTSGLPNFGGHAFFLHSPSIELLDEARALRYFTRARRAQFPPGTDWSYSDDGYFLGRMIVERVTGQPFPQFMAERVFAPLGMTNSRFGAESGTWPNRAYTYFVTEGGPRLVVARGGDLGGWGVKTTLNDLARWEHNFTTGRVGGRALVSRALSPGRLVTGEVVEYGIGWELVPYRGLARQSHGGVTEGGGAELWRFPGTGLAVATLCNRDDVDTYTVARDLADLALADRLSPEPPLASSSTDAALRGNYISARGITFAIEVEGDRLVYRAGRLVEPLRRLSATQVIGIDPLEIVPGGLRLLSPMGRDVEYHRYDPAIPNRAASDAYLGRYLAPDFDAIIRVERSGDGIALRLASGDVLPLWPTIADAFSGSHYGVFGLRFLRDGTRRVTGMTIDRNRTRDIRLERIGD